MMITYSPVGVAASVSETSLSFYPSALRSSTEDSHLHTRRHENFKSEL
jgi:hypothetical protein